MDVWGLPKLPSLSESFERPVTGFTECVLVKYSWLLVDLTMQCTVFGPGPFLVCSLFLLLASILLSEYISRGMAMLNVSTWGMAKWENSPRGCKETLLILRTEFPFKSVEKVAGHWLWIKLQPRSHDLWRVLMLALDGRETRVEVSAFFFGHGRS